MLKLLLLLVAVLFSPIARGQDSTQLLSDQKRIVAELSGHQQVDNTPLIPNRGSQENRQLAREYLASMISSIGLSPSYQNYSWPNVNPIVDLLFEPFEGANVYTILPATSSSETYIVIGAHLDTERNCPGAIDNATGVAISFGVVSLLAELEERNAHVILVYFDQEEEDLIGSQAFAKKLKDENFHVLSVHTLDTMGWDRDDDHAIEIELPSEALEELYTSIRDKLGIPIYPTKVNSTDHHSFRELGFDALGLTDELLNGDYAPYKDTEKDTYETVNFSYVESCTKLVFEVFKELVK